MAGVSLPPNLRISTITATSKINCLVDIAKVYEILEIDNHFKYIEFGNKPNKGVSQKHISDKKRLKKKVFFNQITVEVVCNNITNNIKLFNNGSISMTGIKDIEIGKQSIRILFRYLLSKDIETLKQGKISPVFSTPEPEIIFFKIVLINSDFKLDFEIKRSELHQILVNRGIYSSYEPCIYPGVNSKYYWNSKYIDRTYTAFDFKLKDSQLFIVFDALCKDITLKLREELNDTIHIDKYSSVLASQINCNFKYIFFDMTDKYLQVRISLDSIYDLNLIDNIKTGIKENNIKLDINYKYRGSCYCNGLCGGKGSGNGEQACKKVTVSAFQSGSIIITGANTTRQIFDSYHFINNIITDHIGKIKKDITSQKKMDEIIYIKKSAIQCI